MLIIVVGSLTAVSAEKVTLRYTTWQGIQYQSMEQEMIAEFGRDYPSIDVQYETYATGYWDKIATFMAAGNAPDVMLMSWLFEIPRINTGMFVDLTPLMRRDQMNARDYFPPIMDHWRYKGGLYGMPLRGEAVALFYNRDMFTTLGLEDPNALYNRGDWSWNGLLSNARKMTRDMDGDGTLDQWGMSALYSGTLDRGYALFPALNGVAFLNEERTKTNIDSEAAIRGYEFMVDLAWTYKVTAPRDNFIEGMVGFDSSGGSWRVQSYSDQITTFQWGVVPWPQGPAGKDKYSTIVAPLALGIPIQTKHLEEAWSLVTFLTNRKSLEQLMRTGAGIPSLISATRVASIYREGAPRYTSRFLDLMQTGHDPWVSGVNDPVALQTEFAKAMSPMVTGAVSVQATVAELARVVNLMLNRQ